MNWIFKSLTSQRKNKILHIGWFYNNITWCVIQFSRNPDFKTVVIPLCEAFDTKDSFCHFSCDRTQFKRRTCIKDGIGNGGEASYGRRYVNSCPVQIPFYTYPPINVNKKT